MWIAVNRRSNALSLFELSLPVVSQQFRPSTAILAASGGFRRNLGVSGAEFGAGSDGESRPDKVELAESLRCSR